MKTAVVAGILLITLFNTVTHGRSDCSGECLSNFCNATFLGAENLCSLNALSEVSTCSSSECNNAILKCQSSQPTLFLEDSENCNFEFKTTPLSPENGVGGSFGAGFYIIRPYCFRKINNNCIKDIQLHAHNVDLNTGELLEFHVYERFKDDLQIIFVEQFSFNVSLLHSNGIWTATPVNPRNEPLCLQGGEYLGFTIRGNLRINSTQEFDDYFGPSEGVLMFNQAPISQCSSVNTTLEIGPKPTINQLPLMDIQYFETQITTEIATSSIGTTFAISNTGTTEMTTSSTGTSFMPSSGASFQKILFIAAGIVIPGLVVGAVLITVIILLRYFYLKRKLRSNSNPNIYEVKDGDIVSMNSLDSTYQNNCSFECPIGNKDVETVINPVAELEAVQVDRIYDEPLEMDKARAWPSSNIAHSHPNGELPSLMLFNEGTVNNIHYASPPSNFGGQNNYPSNPDYQDPNELAGTPMMKTHRSTVKNQLYASTEEFGLKTSLRRDGQQYDSGGQLNAIYDKPSELGIQPVKPSIVPSVRVNTLYESSDEDDFRAKSDSMSESNSEYVGADYSIPVTCDSEQEKSNSDPIPDAKSKSIIPTNDMSLSKKDMAQLSESDPESCGEIAGKMDHYYHILDKNGNPIEDCNTEDDHDGTAKSNVHHVVNEPGAYVPNSEERREMYISDTLSPQLFEAWKKTSYKKGKFFVRLDKFWVPSQNKATLFDQLSQKKFREIFKDQFRENLKQVHSCSELLASPWELLSFPGIIISHIGHGQFGSVQKAKLNYSGGSFDVAVKVMKPSIQENAQVKFLQEAAIMGQFFHSNIIKLYGIVTLNNPLMIVMEYMPLGDLQSYLCKHYRHSEAVPPQPVTLLKFCQQIAYGMAYLARKHFVHRDLAARNIFISSTLVCKVGDFGMSRNLMDEEYYKSQGGVVPIKWTAPEGLLYKKYTTASDVYSFGMTMFEIWSLGEKPLRDLPIQHVAKAVAGGYCQAPPPGTPRRIYEVMVQCWNPDQSRRSSFDELLNILQNSDERLLDWLDGDLEKMISPQARVIGSALEEGHSLYKDLQNSYHGTPDITM